MDAQAAIGENIRTLRKQMGLSQQDLADAAKLSLMTINRTEKGRQMPQMDNLRAIADALGVSTTQLMMPPEEWADIKKEAKEAPRPGDFREFMERLDALEKIAFRNVASEVEILQSKVSDLEARLAWLPPEIARSLKHDSLSDFSVKYSTSLDSVAKIPRDILAALTMADEDQIHFIRVNLGLLDEESEGASGEDAG